MSVRASKIASGFSRPPEAISPECIDAAMFIRGRRSTYPHDARAIHMSLLLLFNSASDPPPPELVLNAVLELGDAKAEGMLVEAVAIPWFVILDRIRDDPGAAHQIPPRVWEEIIAGAYTRAGFDEVILTPRSGDNRIRSELVVRVGY